MLKLSTITAVLLLTVTAAVAAAPLTGDGVFTLRGSVDEVMAVLVDGTGLSFSFLVVDGAAVFVERADPAPAAVGDCVEISGLVQARFAEEGWAFRRSAVPADVKVVARNLCGGEESDQ